MNLRFGMREIARVGLSGKIEPPLSRSALEDNIYVCFTKGRVSPSLVDAFARALKQFKQTEAFRRYTTNIIRNFSRAIPR